MLRRRDVLGAGIMALGFGVPAWAKTAAEGNGTLRFRLKETAGLRRFGYPVHTLLPSNTDGMAFRLERGGQPVPAQFRRVTGPGGRPAVALDFNASPGPLEAEDYTVRTGPGVEPGPEPRGGMRVEHVGDGFDVTNGSALAFRVTERLGFLRSVRNARLDFLREGSPGLSLTSRDGDTKPLGAAGDVDGPGFRGTVTRQGPLAVGLRFEGSTRFGGAGEVKSTVDMTFPNSKSWVEVRWTVGDPGGLVAVLGVALFLKIDGAPVLVDFGASDTVYGFVRGPEAMRLVGGDAPGLPPLKTRWWVDKSTRGTVSPLAKAPSPDAAPAEGWAHVMDRTRCTALAVADFGRAGRDMVEVTGDGRVAIVRTYARSGPEHMPPKGTKSLRFWLHFVPNPVQIGAATSPQAMLAPLVVEWGTKPGNP